MIATLDRSPDRPANRQSAGAASTPGVAFGPIVLRARPFEAVGGTVLRYGLVLFLVGIGLLKFTEAEAQAIQPLVAHSPFMSWLYAIATVTVASAAIGVLEFTIGTLLAIGRWFPRISVLGSLGASVMFVITLSFMFTTPGLSGDMSGFLMKDLMLFGAAVWTAGDSLRRAGAR